MLPAPRSAQEGPRGRHRAAGADVVRLNAVIGMSGLLLETELDDDTQDGVSLTNVAGVTQWWNGAPTKVGAQGPARRSFFVVDAKPVETPANLFYKVAGRDGGQHEVGTAFRRNDAAQGNKPTAQQQQDNDTCCCCD